jgi:hypothetical protein
LIRVMSRSRGNSSATVIPSRQSPSQRHPPVPSYSDAVRQGAGRDRSDSARLPPPNRTSSNRPRSSTSA